MRETRRTRCEGEMGTISTVGVCGWKSVAGRGRIGDVEATDATDEAAAGTTTPKRAEETDECTARCVRMGTGRRNRTIAGMVVDDPVDRRRRRRSVRRGRQNTKSRLRICREVQIGETSRIRFDAPGT
jgi:hypothetical protein